MSKPNGIKDVTSVDSVITVSVKGGVAKPRPAVTANTSNRTN